MYSVHPLPVFTVYLSGIGVTKLESAFLDLQPDNALDLNKKRRLLRWDAKKRKFVKQSLEEMSNVKGLKRLRTESGAPIKQSKIPQVKYLLHMEFVFEHKYICIHVRVYVYLKMCSSFCLLPSCHFVA